MGIGRRPSRRRGISVVLIAIACLALPAVALAGFPGANPGESPRAQRPERPGLRPLRARRRRARRDSTAPRTSTRTSGSSASAPTPPTRPGRRPSCTPSPRPSTRTARSSTQQGRRRKPRRPATRQCAADRRDPRRHRLEVLDRRPRTSPSRSSTRGSAGRSASWSTRSASTPPSCRPHSTPTGPTAPPTTATATAPSTSATSPTTRGSQIAAGDSESDSILDGSDLIATFSDGTDADANGYVDDIAGWDFFDDDNDPFDASSCCCANGHGTGRAQEAVAETEQRRRQRRASARTASCMPLRVWDTFVVPIDNYAMGVALRGRQRRQPWSRARSAGSATRQFARSVVPATPTSRGVALTLVSSRHQQRQPQLPDQLQRGDLRRRLVPRHGAERDLRRPGRPAGHRRRRQPAARRSSTDGCERAARPARRQPRRSRPTASASRSRPASSATRT